VHGHPELAASRRAAYEYVTANSWRNALDAALGQPDTTVFLYDIGGARMGIESALRFIDALPEKYAVLRHRVYVHVSMPVLSGTDANRSRVFERHANRIAFGNPELLSVGVAQGTGSRLSVCDHTVGACNCVPQGLIPTFISVHSLYYLGDSELSSMAERYVGCRILAAIHRPSPTGVLPAENPEFTWLAPSAAPELFTWQERAVSRLRAIFLDDPTIAMIPMRNAGTVYKHSAMRWLSDGG
jgi:hypothetical protein